MKVIKTTLAIVLMLSALNAYSQVSCTYTLKQDGEKIAGGTAGSDPVEIELESSNWQSCSISRMRIFDSSFEFNGKTIPRQSAGISAVCLDKEGQAFELLSSIKVSDETDFETHILHFYDKATAFDPYKDRLNIEQNSRQYQLGLSCLSFP